MFAIFVIVGDILLEEISIYEFGIQCERQTRDSLVPCGQYYSDDYPTLMLSLLKIVH